MFLFYTTWKDQKTCLFTEFKIVTLATNGLISLLIQNFYTDFKKVTGNFPKSYHRLKCLYIL